MIGIIGSGVIGIGVAQVFAIFGYDVLLIDNQQSALEKSEIELKNQLRYWRMMKKNNIDFEIEDVKSRIKFSSLYDGLVKCKFIVENITEDEEKKIQLYQEINEFCDESCVFLVNTSCISITKLSKYVKIPQNMIGVHFMNPVPIKDTVEIIRGKMTSDETLHKVQKLLGLIGKNGVVVNDRPGFVSNRLSHLFMNEAAKIVEEGVASPEDVDMIFKKCFGHSMGPFETADLIGIDTVVNSIYVLHSEYNEEKFVCSKLLEDMVEQGKLGRKTRSGFYTY